MTLGTVIISGEKPIAKSMKERIDELDSLLKASTYKRQYKENEKIGSLKIIYICIYIK